MHQVSSFCEDKVLTVLKSHAGESISVAQIVDEGRIGPRASSKARGVWIPTPHPRADVIQAVANLKRKGYKIRPLGMRVIWGFQLHQGD